MLNGIAFRELPAPGAERLVDIHQIVEGNESRHSEGTSSGFSTAEYLTYRNRARTLTGLLGYSSQQWTVSLGEDAPRQVPAVFVTCNYFDVLRRPPALRSG